MSLDEIQPGQYCIVKFARKGRGAQRRLADLGILPGTQVQVLARHPVGGPIILKLGESHVAIGRSLASAIEVTPVAKTAYPE